MFRASPKYSPPATVTTPSSMPMRKRATRNPARDAFLASISGRDRDRGAHGGAGVVEDRHEVVADEVDECPAALRHPALDEVPVRVHRRRRRLEVIGDQPAVPDHVGVEGHDLGTLLAQGGASPFPVAAGDGPSRTATRCPAPMVRQDRRERGTSPLGRSGGPRHSKVPVTPSSAPPATDGDVPGPTLLAPPSIRARHVGCPVTCQGEQAPGFGDPLWAHPGQCGPARRTAGPGPPRPSGCPFARSEGSEHARPIVVEGVAELVEALRAS